MNSDKFKTGDFGKASFKFDKPKYVEGVTTTGKIVAIGDEWIDFTDNDGICYRVRKDRFKFEKIVHKG